MSRFSDIPVTVQTILKSMCRGRLHAKGKPVIVSGGWLVAWRRVLDKLGAGIENPVGIV